MRRGETAEAAGRADRALRLGDYAYRAGRIYLRKTGNSARIDRALIAEVAIWLTFTAIVRARGALLRLLPGRRPAIWFTPDVPAGRYTVRAAAAWAGIAVARSPGAADAAFFFDDATRSVPPPAPPIPAFNFACNDIRKSRVAALFAQAAGYPLAVDPLRWRGDAVEKSEVNGAHDGRVIRCPCPPQPERAYQRLIDTIGPDGCAVDLRTHCIGGVPVIVWVKRRLADRRFLPPNLSATSHPPAAIFSDDEIALICRFVALIGADWCALDILRDRDGRIYIVDVNKTDAGPIIALPMREKLRSTAVLARALERMMPCPARCRAG